MTWYVTVSSPAGAGSASAAYGGGEDPDPCGLPLSQQQQPGGCPGGWKVAGTGPRLPLGTGRRKRTEKRASEEAGTDHNVVSIWRCPQCGGSLLQPSYSRPPGGRVMVSTLGPGG